MNETGKNVYILPKNSMVLGVLFYELAFINYI